MNRATDQQLIQIIFGQEDCSLEERYAAARELHIRKNQDTSMSNPAIQNLSSYLQSV